MDANKRKKLKTLGGRVTTVKAFLGLDEQDVAAIEARLTMAEGIRKGRTEAGLTQAELGRRIGSSQARVAKMEGGDPPRVPYSPMQVNRSVVNSTWKSLRWRSTIAAA